MPFAHTASVAVLALLFLVAGTAAAAAAPSDVDLTFGTSGSTTIKPGEPFSESRDAILDASGRVVMVGNQGGGSWAWALARLTSGGAPDESFDADGKRTLQVAGGGGATAVALQADGKLVVAGTAGGGEVPYLPEFAVIRLHPDGSLDEDFGTGGIVRTPLAPGDGWTATPEAVVVQPDGKILVAGSSPQGGGHVTLVRYDSGGELDSGFGGGSGVVHHQPPGGTSSALAAALDGQGRIVVAGFAPDVNGDRVAMLARFTSAGEVDAEFGDGGIARADWESGGTKENVARDLIVLPDGKLVVAGLAYAGAVRRMAVARFSGDGDPDLTFGSGGVILGGPGTAEANAVARTGHGKLLVGGWAEPGDPAGMYQALMQVGTDGQLDTGFGTGGIVIHRVGTDATQARDVLVQPADGRVVLTGFAGSSFAATRFVGEPPPDPDANDPGETTGPEADPTAGCEAELRLALVVARAACFRTEGAWKVSQERVRINGLDLVPFDGTVIRLDPAGVRLMTQAPGGGVGLVDVFAGSVQLARTGFDTGLHSGLTFRAAGSASIDDFRISSDVTTSFTAEGVARLEAGISMPRLSGALSATLSMDTGLVLDSLAISLPSFAFGPLGSAQPLNLSFVPAQHLWSGSSSFTLGRGPRAIVFAGTMAMADGDWRQVTGSIAELPFSAVPLRGLSLTFRQAPGALQVTGAANVPAGMLSGLSTFRMTGSLAATVPLSVLDWQDSDWRLRGTATLVGNAALVGGEIRWQNALPVFTGRAEWGFKSGQFFNLGPSGPGTDTMDASVSSDVRYAYPQATGSGTARVFGLGFGIDLTYGSQGVGACGDVRVGVGKLSRVVRAGVAVRFDPTRYSALVGSCDIWWLTSAPTASAAAATTGERTVRVPGGQRVAVLAVRGRGGSPRVRVSGPGGVRIATGASDRPQRHGRFLVLREPGRDMTYVLVATPPGGRWSVRAMPGSPAIRSVTAAAALPPVRIRGTVTKARGGRRVLRWRGRGVRGHAIRLREVGRDVNRPLRTVRRASGRLTFRPAEGAPGARRIVAVVERGGMPRATLRVARFKP